MGRITQDPFVLDTIKEHLLQFNQKLPLVKPTCKCEVRVSMTQESMMASEVRSMLSEGTMEVCPGNNGFFTYSFFIPMKIWESCSIMNLKQLNWFITCRKFKMTTLNQIREAIHPGQWAVSLNIKSAYCLIPISWRHYFSLTSGEEAKSSNLGPCPLADPLLSKPLWGSWRPSYSNARKCV